VKLSWKSIFKWMGLGGASIFLIIALYVVYFFTIGGGLFGKPSLDEARRINSPDHMVDAVLAVINAGATTDFSYQVFIVSPGEKVTLSSPSCFVADHVFGDLNLEWKGPKLLEIRYGQIRLFKLIETWQSKEIQNSGYVVKIRLIPKSKRSLLTKP